MKEKELTCVVCGKKFVQKMKKDNGYWRKTCSKECYKKLRSPRKTLKCETCGKEFEVIPYRADKAKFCSRKCLEKAWLGKDNPNWKGGLDSSIYSTKEWKEARETRLKKDGYKCTICGSDHNLEVHHILPYRLSKSHDMVNLITLCNSCHPKFEKDTQKLIGNKISGHPRFTQLLCELWLLHQRKNSDYATEREPLGNFTRVGEWCKKYKIVTPGHEAMKVAIIYQLKQLDAMLKLLMEGEEGMVEGIPKRLEDVAVYAIIERILYEEGK